MLHHRLLRLLFAKAFIGGSGIADVKCEHQFYRICLCISVNIFHDNQIKMRSFMRKLRKNYA